HVDTANGPTKVTDGAIEFRLVEVQLGRAADEREPETLQGCRDQDRVVIGVGQSVDMLVPAHPDHQRDPLLLARDEIAKAARLRHESRAPANDEDQRPERDAPRARPRRPTFSRLSPAYHSTLIPRRTTEHPRSARQARSRHRMNTHSAIATCLKSNARS